MRFCVLKLFNSLVQATLPLIDLSIPSASTNQQYMNLGQLLSILRPLIFFEVKYHFMQEVLTKTSCINKESPQIYVDRLEAAKEIGMN